MTNFIISLGENCITATFLNLLGYRNHAFPFDWTFTRIDTIKDCLSTNFTSYLDKSLYYPIRNEHTVINSHKIYGESFFNHKNPLLNEQDYLYTQRCVKRFLQIIEDESLHVTFVFTVNCFNTEISQDFLRSSGILELKDSLKEKCKCKFTLKCIVLTSLYERKYEKYDDVLDLVFCTCKEGITAGIQFNSEDDKSSYIEALKVVTYNPVPLILKYKLAILYTNCHGHAYQRQLIYNDFVTYHIFLQPDLFSKPLEENLLTLIKDCDVFIYQHITEKSKTLMKSVSNNLIDVNQSRILTTEVLKDLLKDTCTQVSVSNPYCKFLFFNLVPNEISHGIEYPYINKHIVEIGRTSDNIERDLRSYLNDNYYDCEILKEYVRCLEDLILREENCDVKHVPFLIKNLRKRRLFLTHNHPSVVLMEYMCKEITKFLNIKYIEVNNDNLVYPLTTFPIDPSVINTLNIDFTDDLPLYDYYFTQIMKITS